jgi:SAM-dependent methyltransferase
MVLRTYPTALLARLCSGAAAQRARPAGRPARSRQAATSVMLLVAMGFKHLSLKGLLYPAVRRFQRVAERSGKDWLIYNPLLMYELHAFATRDSAAVARSFQRVFPEAQSFVDVGAGSGAFSAELQRRGYRVVACERSRFGRRMARRQGVDSRPFELSKNPPADLPRGFDVAFSFEVAEHVPPGLSRDLVHFIVSLAPTIAFTAAPPGQPGQAHINLRPPSYWIGLFEALGVAHDPHTTETLRSAFLEESVWAPWLTQNIMVFRRTGSKPRAGRPALARGANRGANMSESEVTSEHPKALDKAESDPS